METPLTPLDFARRARRLDAEREAVVEGASRWTYRQFFERCDRWSAALQRLKVRKNDRVAIIASNTHAHLESSYAIPQIGAVLVPINFRLTENDFAYILEHSGARVVCVESAYLEKVDRIRSRLPQMEHFVAFGGAGDGWLDHAHLVESASPVFDRAEIDESDLLSINYTSGTTARPKGVMITHRNAYLNILAWLTHLHLTSSERYLWTVPMFHANGWTFVWGITAVGGAHICLPKFDVRMVYELIARESVTLLCAAPTVLISLANAPEELRRLAPRNVRVITAGAPPAAATIERIEHELGWTVTQIYGLTETSPMISICEPRAEHNALTPRARAEIKARQGVECIGTGEIRVVDSGGSEVPRDGQTLGEITVKGNAVMAGYYRDPEATARAIRDGWFYTGDAAVVHPDGFMEIRDRWKDVIISGGENISSIEVECALLRHPAVLEVAVVGLPHEKWGESPQAFVVLKSGLTTTAAELSQFARDNLAHFKVPAGFTFMEALPKTATGKIKKYILRGGRANLSPQ